jgi:hypothetical protein
MIEDHQDSHAGQHATRGQVLITIHSVYKLPSWRFEHACFVTVWSCYYIVAESGSSRPLLRLSLHKLLAYWLLERPVYMSV